MLVLRGLYVETKLIVCITECCCVFQYCIETVCTCTLGGLYLEIVCACCLEYLRLVHECYCRRFSCPSQAVTQAILFLPLLLSMNMWKKLHQHQYQHQCMILIIITTLIVLVMLMIINSNQ